MNINELAVLITEREKGKREVDVAQTKEIVNVLAVIIYENPELVEKLLAYGRRKSRK